MAHDRGHQHGSSGQAPDAGELAPGAALPWAERRRRIERAWLDLLGEFPAEVPPLQPALREVAREGGLTRYHVSFRAQADDPQDRVTAWLLVPDRARRAPAPGMVCVHSTTFGTGKDSTVGLAGMFPGDPPEQWAGRYRNPDPGQAYGLDLARRGYVTLSIDLLTDGERIRPGERLLDTRGFYARYPEWSMVGKNAWDIRRSVDYLQSLEFVDSERIGCIGWSLGAHSAVFAGAFDPRLGATVSIGGVLDWHRARGVAHWARSDEHTPSPELARRFGFQPDSGPYIYIKKFRPYAADPERPVPVDFGELMMLVAPRPLLLLSTEWEFYSHKLLPKCLAVAEVYASWRDGDVPGQPGVVAARQARAGYDRTLAYYAFHNGVGAERMPGMLAQLGAGDCFGWFSYPGGHGLPRAARGVGFAWLDRWLGHEPAPPEGDAPPPVAGGDSPPLPAGAEGSPL